MAAVFRGRPISSGRVTALAIPGATPLQGVAPITVGGKVIGTPQEDGDIAKVGAAVFG
jgi:hypothetical protein